MKNLITLAHRHNLSDNQKSQNCMIFDLIGNNNISSITMDILGKYFIENVNIVLLLVHSLLLLILLLEIGQLAKLIKCLLNPLNLCPVY